jgi:hypothetical protein
MKALVKVNGESVGMFYQVAKMKAKPKCTQEY